MRMKYYICISFERILTAFIALIDETRYNETSTS